MSCLRIKLRGVRKTLFWPMNNCGGRWSGRVASFAARGRVGAGTVGEARPSAAAPWAWRAGHRPGTPGGPWQRSRGPPHPPRCEPGTLPGAALRWAGSEARGRAPRGGRLSVVTEEGLGDSGPRALGQETPGSARRPLRGGSSGGGAGLLGGRGRGKAARTGPVAPAAPGNGWYGRVGSASRGHSGGAAPHGCASGRPPAECGPEKAWERLQLSVLPNFLIFSMCFKKGVGCLGILTGCPPGRQARRGPRAGVAGTQTGWGLTAGGPPLAPRPSPASGPTVTQPGPVSPVLSQRPPVLRPPIPRLYRAGRGVPPFGAKAMQTQFPVHPDLFLLSQLSHVKW